MKPGDPCRLRVEGMHGPHDFDAVVHMIGSDGRQRRPLGFRMPERKAAEPGPALPDWLLPC